MASLRDRLIGAWRLAEFTVTAEDGTVTYPMGEDVEGLIIYTPDGYMSAQLMEPGRPAYASGEFTHGTTEEEAAAAAGYLAYSGPFYVNEETATLITCRCHCFPTGSTRPRNASSSWRATPSPSQRRRSSSKAARARRD